MANSDYHERETALLATQMREVRSKLADVASRRNGLSEIGDSVAQLNMELQLRHERERAFIELNRIAEDLRKLALVEQERAVKEAEQQRQAQRDDANTKEALSREDGNKQEALNREEANKEQQLKEALLQKDQQLREDLNRQDREKAEALVQKDQQLREAFDRQDREKTEGRDRSGENNPVVDALSAGTLAIVKAADVWLEAKQLMEHYAERLALEQDQQRRKEDLEKEFERQAYELAVSMNARGKTELEIVNALDQQALIQERHRAEQQEQFEKEQQELAARQAQLERERNERADRDSISL